MRRGRIKKILWLAAEPPVESQIVELRRLFGASVEIDHDRNTHARPDDVVLRVRLQYLDVVVVAAQSYIQRLYEAGLQPLYALMEPATSDKAEVTVPARGQQPARHFRFVEFERVVLPGQHAKLDDEVLQRGAVRRW